MFSVVLLIRIVIWDYVIAVNGNGFGDNFLCSLFLLLCFLMKVAIRDYVIAVNGNGFGDNFICSVYFLLCFLINIASGITLLQLTLMDLVTISFALYIFCCVF